MMNPRPCPFCGTAPKVGPTDPKREGDAFGYVQCVNDECPAKPHVDDGERLNDSRGTEAYQALAIARWNRRAQDEPIGELLGTVMKNSGGSANPETVEKVIRALSGERVSFVGTPAAPTRKPEFFWSPPDGAPIVGMTTYEGFIVVATSSGVYTIQSGPHRTPDDWTVQKISLAVRRNEEPD